MEANYKYNALGQRMMKIVSYPTEPSKSFIRKFTFDGDEILSEFDGDNNRLVTYTHSTLRTDDTLSADVTAIGQVKKIAKEAGSFFFLKDALGSITDITDSSGNLKEHIAYSSFGSILKVTDELNQDKTTDKFFNFRYSYTNRELDTETGLFYYRARYYDSKIGRFIEEDPHPGKASIPKTLNSKYIYTLNNPTNNVDPEGKFLVTIGVFLLAAAKVGAITTVATVAIQAALGNLSGLSAQQIFTFAAQSFIVNTISAGFAIGTAGILTGSTSLLGLSLLDKLVVSAASVTGTVFGGVVVGLRPSAKLSSKEFLSKLVERSLFIIGIELLFQSSDAIAPENADCFFGPQGRASSCDAFNTEVN